MPFKVRDLMIYVLPRKSRSPRPEPSGGLRDDDCTNCTSCTACSGCTSCSNCTGCTSCSKCTTCSHESACTICTKSTQCTCSACSPVPSLPCDHQSRVAMEQLGLEGLAELKAELHKSLAHVHQREQVLEDRKSTRLN